MTASLAINCYARKQHNTRAINYSTAMDKKTALTLAANVDREMRVRGWTQKQLAKKADVSQRNISGLLSILKDPGAEPNPTLETIEGIARAFGASSSMLLSDRANIGETAATYGPESNVGPGPELRGRVPLISWVQAGQWNEVADPYAKGVAEDWILTGAKVGAQAYALRVRGDSMAPEFSEGDIIIVDPDVEATNGKFVIVRLDDAKEATFKQLVTDGGKQYLKPINPRYPIIEINENATFCGAIVGKFKSY